MDRIAVRLPRALTTVVAVAGLITAGPLQAAGAAPAHHRSRREQAPITYLLKTPSEALQAKPYHLTVSVETESPQVLGLTILFTRKAKTGNHPVQSHEWFFQLPVADVPVASNLSQATIHTHTDLGKFGAIDLTLNNPSALSTTTTRCPGGGAVTGSISKRTGTLEGDFEFHAFDGYINTIHRVSFPVSVKKTVVNGTSCPVPLPTCNQEKQVLATDATTSLEEFGARPIGGTTSSVIFELGSVDGPAQITHKITVTGPAKSLVVTSSFTSTIHGNVAAPWGSGTVTYVANGSPTSTTSNHCKNIEQQLVYSTGTISVAFDSGGTQTLSSGNGLATKTVKV